MTEHKLELKILTDSNGTEIDLANMSAPATKAFIVLLQSLTEIIESTKNDSLRIEIKKGSAVAIAKGSEKDIKTLEDDFQEVIKSNCSNAAIVEGWRNIQTLFAKNGLTYDANFYNIQKKTSISDSIKTKKKFKLKRTRHQSEYKLFFLKGNLLEIGGKYPNIHIVDLNNTKYTISCDINHAIKVQTFLYKDIHIAVWKKEIEGKKPQYSYADFYSDIEVYNSFKSFFDLDLDFDDSDDLLNLHEEIEKYLNEKNFDILRKFLRLFDHPSVSINALKTILVASKHFKTNDRIKPLRDSLLKIYEDKRLSFISNKITS